MKTTIKIPLALLGLLVLATACSDSPYDDVHSAPREAKPWEDADLANLGSEQLLARLQLLASEAVSSAEGGETIEFHHLEVALTPTLEKLETFATGNPDALATLASLKALALKLHEAGHDQNAKVGAKITVSLQRQTARLATELRE